jgi:hypothetical protein
MASLDLGHLGEQVLEATRQETSVGFAVGGTLDGKGLSRASLSICEDRAIVATHALVDYVLAHAVEDMLLAGGLPSDVVERETLVGHELEGLVVLAAVDAAFGHFIELGLMRR